MPARPVAVLAGAGATAVAILVVYFFLVRLNQHHHWLSPRFKPRVGEASVDCAPPGWEILRWYAPLIAWPPPLGVVTLDHWRRRVRS